MVNSKRDRDLHKITLCCIEKDFEQLRTYICENTLKKVKQAVILIFSLTFIVLKKEYMYISFALDQLQVQVVVFFLVKEKKKMCKTTIQTRNNVQISTIAWTETRLSITLLLKVLILLPGAAERSVFSQQFLFLFFFTAVETCGLNKQTNCYKGSLLLKSSRTKCPLLKTWTLSFSLNPKQMMCVLEKWKGQERGGRGMRVAQSLCELLIT